MAAGQNGDRVALHRHHGEALVHQPGPHDHLGGGHSHVGAMFYLGDNWPEQYRNNIFMFNTHGRRINQDRLVRNGAGYIAMHHGGQPLYPYLVGIE
jgi:hypothetical protein